MLDSIQTYPRYSGNVLRVPTEVKGLLLLLSAKGVYQEGVLSKFRQGEDIDYRHESANNKNPNWHYVSPVSAEEPEAISKELANLSLAPISE